MPCQPRPDFGRVEADEPPHLDERNSSLLDETSYMSWRRAERFGNLDSVEKRRELLAPGSNRRPLVPGAHRSGSAISSWRSS